MTLSAVPLNEHILQNKEPFQILIDRITRICTETHQQSKLRLFNPAHAAGAERYNALVEEVFKLAALLQHDHPHIRPFYLPYRRDQEMPYEIQDMDRFIRAMRDQGYRLNGRTGLKVGKRTYLLVNANTYPKSTAKGLLEFACLNSTELTQRKKSVLDLFPRMLDEDDDVAYLCLATHLDPEYLGLCKSIFAIKPNPEAHGIPEALDRYDFADDFNLFGNGIQVTAPPLPKTGQPRWSQHPQPGLLGGTEDK
ncbi:hypothetical protein [Deinococcus roseus]|uniref:Uncharacterized protein n=1 Tax=Deinococcus roseus TaxID=392414 RepID=A0ABQ2DI02_9DEIO|nr:hypothetical protein [Deinococcus roseus]GGJ58422.1 hypothetical protein GCM10008938_50630 [Deinococcus roseus]